MSPRVLVLVWALSRPVLVVDDVAELNFEINYGRGAAAGYTMVGTPRRCRRPW